MLKKIQSLFEMHVYGVCERLGEIMGLSSSSIRMFFVYASFLAYGSPIIVYLAMAFVMNMRKHLRKKRSFYYEV